MKSCHPFDNVRTTAAAATTRIQDNGKLAAVALLNQGVCNPIPLIVMTIILTSAPTIVPSHCTQKVLPIKVYCNDRGRIPKQLSINRPGKGIGVTIVEVTTNRM